MGAWNAFSLSWAKFSIFLAASSPLPKLYFLNILPENLAIMLINVVLANTVDKIVIGSTISFNSSFLSSKVSFISSAKASPKLSISFS